MPPNSEIEKLERHWKDNPKGTVFAPYAEVLRKHGDYPLAKDVLRQGLELHPNHIPGNIVLGRCCLDLGEEGPAEAAFTHVLDLDGENVIALKALAEITERQGRLMEAVNWLTRLIAVDPSNEEAREQLQRVDKARETASATMAPAPAPTTAASPPAEKTEVLPVIQPPTPPALELSTAETDAGVVGDAAEVGQEGDTDAAIDAALGRLSGPTVAPPLERAGSNMGSPAAAGGHVDEPSPVGRELLGAMAEPAPDLEPSLLSDPAPVDLDVGSGAAPPAGYVIGLEDPASIELLPSTGGEFEVTDDSAALLELASGQAEFQEPDASAELASSGSGSSEYQTPSGAEDLLQSVAGASPAAPPPGPVLETSVTTGFAAISLMPTQEMPSSAEPPGLSVIEALKAAGEAPSPVAQPEEAAEIPRPSGDLPLIFPDEVSEAAPPRIRRISEETAAVKEPQAPAEDEPAPVVTETMAELYARQGHIGEALNVYRILVTQRPNDNRLASRLRELEETQATGSRRMSYVAIDTGGESVESFFRSLIDARPASTPGAAAPEGGESVTAAPTRPAKDPLSLSAIFGEEAAAGSATGTNSTPQRPSSPDSFSFDQFFAGGAAPAPSEPRTSLPSDEDLDQFQNWLKSLKR